MKPKKVLNKKLVLSKNTIANLNHLQMKGLKGGEITDTCPSFPATCKPLQCGPSLECATPDTTDYSWCDTGCAC